MENTVSLDGNKNENINLKGSLNIIGARGYSAYEVWLQQGNKGTVEDFFRDMGRKLKAGKHVEITIDDVINVFGFLEEDDYLTKDEIHSLIQSVDLYYVTYDDFLNKPKINGVELQGDLSLDDLNIQEKGNYLEIESDPTVPEHVKTISKTDINNWNSKSNFSGNYDDLNGKPQEKTRLSEFQNDVNFITSIPSEYKTKDENDLLYQQKGDYAPKSDIPKKLSDLQNDKNYVEQGYLSDKKLIEKVTLSDISDLVVLPLGTYFVENSIEVPYEDSTWKQPDDHGSYTVRGLIRVDADGIYLSEEGIVLNSYDSSERVFKSVRNYLSHHIDYRNILNTPTKLSQFEPDITLGGIVVELGSYQYNYEGIVLPAIPVTIAREIYTNDKEGVPQTLHWTLLGSENNLKVVSSDYIAGTYSIDVLVHNKYHCEYNWTNDTTGNLNPNVQSSDSLPSDFLTVKDYGAVGDGSRDDTQAFINMFNDLGRIKAGRGTYFIRNSIVLNKGGDIDIDGQILYAGSDYCFTFTGDMHFNNIKVRRFYSDTGGLYKLSPQDNHEISYVNFYLGFGESAKEIFAADATNGIISVISLDGIRWYGTKSDLIKFFVDENPPSWTYLTEINIKNVDLRSGAAGKGINAECKTYNSEIQFNLYEANIENLSGIYTHGKVTSLGIYNCRLVEFLMKDGCIEFNDWLPTVVINGLGWIYPEKIHMNNIINGQYIDTNLTVIDQKTNVNYEGGAVIYKNRFVPKIRKQVYKDITPLIENNVVTYTQDKNGNIYNWFDINTSEATTFNIPKQEMLPEFYITIRQTMDLTIANDTRTMTFYKLKGTYKMIYVGTVLKAINININSYADGFVIGTDGSISLDENYIKNLIEDGSEVSY